MVREISKQTELRKGKRKMALLITDSCGFFSVFSDISALSFSDGFHFDPNKHNHWYPNLMGNVLSSALHFSLPVT